jgi:hypothetical protein
MRKIEIVSLPENVEELAVSDLDIIPLTMKTMSSTWHGLEYADVYAAGYDGYVDACLRFDSSRKVAFRTFASASVRYGIMKFARKEKTFFCLKESAKDWQFFQPKFILMNKAKSFSLDTEAFRRGLTLGTSYAEYLRINGKKLNTKRKGKGKGNELR